MQRSSRVYRDPTIVAFPVYWATMAGEHFVMRRRAANGNESAGNYETRDTLVSLSMGTISLLVPRVAPRLLDPFTPGKGKYGKAVVSTALTAAAITTIADAVEKRSQGRPRLKHAARRVASVGAVTTTVVGGTAAATFWQSSTSLDRFWRRRMGRVFGQGWLSTAVAIAGWDFIYYWNHRFSHESRYMWAIHVVHHSSERYNLSTALRQPVLDPVGTPIPYGALCLFGIAPVQVMFARGMNLLYQYWIHTEVIGRLGAAESTLNTPSHHRVHHGSNLRYIDRNHGSILILWDRLFGTFQPEGEQVVYGLTKNIKTFNLWTVATHEFQAILRDVAGSTSWRERISYVVRGPGWADRHSRSKMAKSSSSDHSPLNHSFSTRWAS